MRPARRIAFALLCASALGGVGAARGDEPVPSGAPGQQGGDPVPDTNAALDLIARGRYDDALVSCRRALGRNEKHVPAMIAMAKAYFYLKKYEFAGSILGLAQKIDPNNAEAWSILAWIQLARDDNKLGALKNLQKAVELNPNYGNAWNSLAAMYLFAKNYDGALEAADKAVALLPNFDKAWLNLGSARRGKDLYAEAEQAYRKALELHTDYAEAWFNLGILYLDAKQIGQLDTQARLAQAINFLSKYKDASTRLPPVANDPVDSYIEEANKAIVQDKKRLERLEKQKAREKAKAAQPPPPPAEPAPAPPATEPAPMPDQPQALPPAPGAN